MKVLVVLGHPDAESFNAAIFAAYVDALDRDKHEVQTLDLGQADFDPVLRYGYRERMDPDPFIERSQELVVWADHIVLVYPIWWASTPSLLKGWIDRVFAPGFAYSINDQGNMALNAMRGKLFSRLLAGRTGEVIATSMGPAAGARLFGGPISLSDTYGIAVVTQTIFKVCGIKHKKATVLGGMGMPGDTAETRAAFLEKVKKRAQLLGS